SRVIESEVEASVALPHDGDRRLELIEPGDVGANRRRRAPLSHDVVGHGLDRVEVATGDNDGRPGSPEMLCRCLADPTAPADDEHDLAFEHWTHLPYALAHYVTEPEHAHPMPRRAILRHSLTHLGRYW